MFKFFAATCLILAFFLQKGSALECYACSTTLASNDCGDPFDGTKPSVKICNNTLTGDNSTVCVKAVISTLGGSTILGAATMRGCADLKTDPCKLIEIAAAKANQTLGHCSTCDSAGLCNSAPKSVGVSIASILLVAFVAFKNLKLA